MRGFPMKILIADDHPVVRHGLKQMLTGEPDMLVVGEAKNGNEAMELARKLEWDVAILDYSMPGRSGLQLLGEIKREFPQRPVLILSMHPEELHARRVLKAGGAGYMNKESAAEELAADAQKPPHETLSDREYRVMWLLASGKPINQIAKEMFLSPSTISTYRVRILKKLGLATNAELVHYTV